MTTQQKPKPKLPAALSQECLIILFGIEIIQMCGAVKEFYDKQTWRNDNSPPSV
jgi:hypothetical protein